MKTILITGVSSGFGHYIAEHLLGQGFNVIGTVRNLESFKNDSINSNPNFNLLHLDLNDKKSVINLVDKLNSEYNIYGLINNAGYALVGHFEELEFTDIEDAFTCNVVHPTLLTQLILPQLRANSGVLINISSLLGVKSNSNFGIYSACKFAIEGLSESLNKELEPFNVKVVLIEPGAFQTNFVQHSTNIGLKTIEAYNESSSKFKKGMVENEDKRESNMELISKSIDIALDRNDKNLRILIGKLAPKLLSNKIEELQSSSIIN